MRYRTKTDAAALLIGSVLLVGCTTAQLNSGSVTQMSDAAWKKCVPIDPWMKELPATPCFRAVLSAENQVTLQWRVVNSLPQVYIYNDFGQAQDIGLRPAVCHTEPQDSCSTTLTVEEGGFMRWLLKVEGPGGARTHVSAAITVPAPYPLKAVYGGDVVDMLSPTAHSVTWIADSRNAPCGETREKAWVEQLNAFSYISYPRCGRAARFSVPADKLGTPGYVDYALRDCHLPEGSTSKFCSPYTLVSFKIGADHFLDPTPVFAQAGRDLEIAFTTDSGDIRRLSSATLIPPDGGSTFLATTESTYRVSGELLKPGVHSITLVSCKSEPEICSPGEKLQVVVGSPMEWESGRDYQEDFYPGVGYAISGTAPIEITYDAMGSIWLINEFSTAVEHISPAGTGSSFTVPLGRHALVDNTYYEKVTPYAFMWGDQSFTTSFSTLGERATRVDSKVWFTLGGGMLPSTPVRNHSRVVSFDPSLSDSPATPYDDRLCVYNVPTDDPGRLGNNQVIGLTATTNRIWLGESRSLVNEEPSAISAFIPDPASCDNLLDFNDPDALANQSMQYCKPDQTPEQDGCMQKFLLDELPRGIKVGHVEADPIDGSIWFADIRGGYLGNLNPNRDPQFKLYPLPPLPDVPASPDPLIAKFRGFPWTVRVDDDAVYIMEHATRRLLRFAKATASFHEIYIPGENADVRLDGIDIDPRAQRLWFTVGKPCICPMDTTASTVGYVDLASWRDYVANPADGAKIAGVLYQDLDTIAAPGARLDQRPNFGGIAVDPATGKIAIATGARNQITELQPKAGFRPQVVD
jgi:streptogramin lyase